MSGTGAGAAAWPVDAVRAAEAVLLAELPEGALMRRAAAGLARRCAELLKDGRGGVYGAHVVVLAGAGNNGGDALIAGGILARRGAFVEALTVRGGHVGGLAELREAGGRVHASGYGEDYGRITTADLVLDGLVGIGGKGELRPEAAALAEAAARARASGAVVVAVDVPSGVDSDTGEVPGPAVAADVTVTFGCLKPGLLVGAGAQHAGLVELVDIGLGPYLADPPLARLVTLAAAAEHWPRPRASDDKYTRGVLGIAAGSATYPGSAVLATGGALAGPAGYIRYAGAAADAVRARHPEVVCTDSTREAGRVQAWVAGSGLGTDIEAEETVRHILATDLPVLLDADAITLAAQHPEWLRGRAAPTLLTPHEREFARIAGPAGPDRVGDVLRAARTFDATFLLKGDRTIVAGPHSPTAYVSASGTPDLGTAGSGDVLSGLAGSLLAAGVPALEAGAFAAFAHGLAGRIAAADGPVSASTVVAALRTAVRTVLGSP
ncbi:MAG: ADP-dependent NAD(P)H-hydrate dehydratase / NAD(P)H-hydrate epimerase [Cryptosporangiaceae bacterium]|jgi:hydroxyethylthiazole kinase-like uncharacterized protein yjeF|nr:ADP-dependent NAD(P)H-hydrate dehydratase / NAD(P)H-hydrate epimerase [Cryptosporangiaceae bacterium]